MRNSTALNRKTDKRGALTEYTKYNMALDDFNTSGGDYSVGNVTTRKDISNVKLDKDGWKVFLGANHAYVGRRVLRSLEESEIKAILELIDDELQSGSPFGWEGDGTDEEQIRDHRQEIAEYLKENY